MRLFRSLSSKVLIFFLFLSALSIAALAWLSYTSSNRVLSADVARSMQSTLTFRSERARDSFTQMASQTAAIGRIEALQQSLTALKSGWNTIQKGSGDAGKELRDIFVTNNPYPRLERYKLVKPEGPSGFYYSSHEAAQGQVSALLANSPFLDLLVADEKGSIIYSYRKSDAFGQVLTSGEWAMGGLGRAFQRATVSAGEARFDIAKPVFSGVAVGADPSAPDMYFALPIVKYAALKSVVFVQIKPEIVQALLQKAAGSLESQQPALVTGLGKAVVLDGQGRLADVSGALYTLPPSQDQALVERDFAASGDAAAMRVYGLATDLFGEAATVVETISLQDLKAGSIAIAGDLALSGFGILIVTALVTAVLTRRLFAPLTHLVDITGQVADGQLDQPVANRDRRDEIGSMARALEQFRERLLEQRRMEAEAREARQVAEAERRERLAEREAEAQALNDVVEALAAGLERLAAGDLARDIPTGFPEALDALRKNFNAARQQLAEALSGIGGNSSAVRDGSDELRAGADQLAERTERQASAITQTASAIQAITESVKLQIAKAEAAARMAGDARKGAEQSGRIMQETIAAMEAIQASSRRINQIISVIDEIAFQTNLLALNAGVEAARAGEAGRGFAVVAQEVRELAQRSASAAREINGLLEKSGREVDSGVQLVEQAGAALAGISEHVTAIDRQIGDIMRSTQEEARTLLEINGSVASLDATTQQNAAMVEETTAAIHRLAGEAAEMDERLGNFRLAEVARRHSA